MYCNQCGFDGKPNLEETGPHTKATCARCNLYIKMVNKEELSELINNQPKPTDEQMKEELLVISGLIKNLISKLSG